MAPGGPASKRRDQPQLKRLRRRRQQRRPKIPWPTRVVPPSRVSLQTLSPLRPSSLRRWPTRHWWPRHRLPSPPAIQALTSLLRRVQMPHQHPLSPLAVLAAQVRSLFGRMPAPLFSLSCVQFISVHCLTSCSVCSPPSPPLLLFAVETLQILSSLS